MRKRILICQNLMCIGNQRGVITLVISLVVLMLSTFVVFNVSKAVLMEQKISNNDTRAKQAFEAAEAGMNVALQYIANNPDVDADGNFDPVFAPDVVTGKGTTNIATIGTARVTVTTTGTLIAPVITAVGESDDRTATKTITQSVVNINPLPNAPQNPVIVRGGIVVGGSATVENPEGFSTIWSGSDVDVGGNNSTTTLVPDLAANGYPACMDTPITCTTVSSSNKLVVGVDVVENDSSLSSLTSAQFFQNFFGMSPTTYRASMVTIDTTGANAKDDADNTVGEVVWVQGDLDVNAITIGSIAKPSIFIVNGNAEISGNSSFSGILFVMGNVEITGNTAVVGSAVIGGLADTTGSLDIVYRSDVLRDTSLAGGSTGGAGSWRDFN